MMPSTETETTEKLCAFGCGRRVHKGARLCRKHLQHQRDKMAEYRSERKKLGLCTRCDNPARRMKNNKVSTLCDTCRERVRVLEQEDRQAATQERTVEGVREMILTHVKTTGTRPTMKTSDDWRSVNLWLRFRQKTTLDKLCNRMGLTRNVQTLES